MFGKDFLRMTAKKNQAKNKKHGAREIRSRGMLECVSVGASDACFHQLPIEDIRDQLHYFVIVNNNFMSKINLLFVGFKTRQLYTATFRYSKSSSSLQELAPRDNSPTFYSSSRARICKALASKLFTPPPDATKLTMAVLQGM